MYHLSIPFPCQVQVKDYEETLCMQGTEEFIIVLEMYPGPGLWHVWRASATLDILSYLVHSSELMSTNYWPQSLKQVSKVVLALIICCQPDQIITQCIRYSVRSRGSLALTRMSMSKHSFHFPGSCSWRLKIEKIRIILQISSDPGVEVFLVQEPGMDFIGDIREAPSTTTRWILTSSIRMHPVKWIVNTHILQVSSLIWSWNVDAGIFLHMLTIVSPVIEVMCSEHFLRTGSGGHSMWSSPWNSVEDECRSQGKSPDVWILTVSWHLKIENREKNQCFDQFFVYLTLLPRVFDGVWVSGSKSLLCTHSELPSVKTSAKS